jgi:hypothetical protein
MPPARLPNQSTALIFHGLKYQGATFDLTIESQLYHLNVRALDSSGSRSLIYEHETQRGTLNVNDLLSFPLDTLLIIRPAVPLCP